MGEDVEVPHGAPPGVIAVQTAGEEDLASRPVDPECPVLGELTGQTVPDVGVAIRVWIDSSDLGYRTDMNFELSLPFSIFRNACILFQTHFVQLFTVFILTQITNYAN